MDSNSFSIDATFKDKAVTVTLHRISPDSAASKRAFLIAESTKGRAVARQEIVASMHLTLDGDVLTWGVRKFTVTDRERVQVLVEQVTALKPPGTQTSTRQVRSARTRLAGAATRIRVVGILIGGVWVAAGVYLLSYRNVLDEHPFVGLGVNSIAAGFVFALVFSFVAAFAEAWLETTEQESE